MSDELRGAIFRLASFLAAFTPNMVEYAEKLRDTFLADLCYSLDAD